jgi:aryl-alcohol dehydrogenase-like predicted oxidoreductase
MEYRKLGRSGLEVSLAGLGCNNFGMTIDEPASAKVVHAALDAGINFFDTADIYGGGSPETSSETFLGRALGTRRHDAIIATKFGLPTGKGPNQSGGSRCYAMSAVEASLERLGTDYIDVYFLHEPDPRTPIEETLDAFDTLISQGKVRYVGCSNFAGWQIADAVWQARTRGLHDFVIAQNQWSLLERKIEAEVVPACERFGLGILPYFPLASGALTGKYRRGQDFDEGSRFGRSEMMRTYYGHMVSDTSLETVERLEKVAADAGLSILELALSWLGSRKVVSSVIAGATRVDQVESNAAATRSDLPADVFAAVDQVLGAS